MRQKEIEKETRFSFCHWQGAEYLSNSSTTIPIGILATCYHRRIKGLLNILYSHATCFILVAEREDSCDVRTHLLLHVREANQSSWASRKIKLNQKRKMLGLAQAVSLKWLWENVYRCSQGMRNMRCLLYLCSSAITKCMVGKQKSSSNYYLEELLSRRTWLLEPGMPSMYLHLAAALEWEILNLWLWRFVSGQNRSMSCDGSKMHLREIYVSQSVCLVGLALVLCCRVNFRKITAQRHKSSQV